MEAQLSPAQLAPNKPVAILSNGKRCTPAAQLRSPLFFVALKSALQEIGWKQESPGDGAFDEAEQG